MIVGPTGRLGQELVSILKFDHQLDLINRLSTDFTASVEKIGRIIRTHKPEVVINATAMNGMEQCAKDPFSAIEINAIVPGVMAGACKDIDARFIHFSTDYVFNGCEGGLREDTFPAPCGTYGRSKYNGEELVQTVGGNYLIFRVSSLYGRMWAGAVEAVNQVLQGKGTAENPIKVLHQFCAPTSTRMVAKAIKHVVENTSDGRGLYHLATSHGIWKNRFAEWITYEIFGKDFVVQEGTLAVPRPEHTQLISTLFEKRFDYKLPSVFTDFSEMLPYMPVVKEFVAK